MITKEKIKEFKEYLINEEKSKATIEKYIHDVCIFCEWLGKRKATKPITLEYKEALINKYCAVSVNSVISSLNSFFDFTKMYDCKLKTLKIQRQIFANKEKELTKAEYERLLKAAKLKSNERLYLVMQTICSTGIRVSELKYITVEAIMRGRADIKCKGKIREILIPKKLCNVLKTYVKSQKITTGSIFITKSGKPLDRTNIWSDMKKLCEVAWVSSKKVFPHNLRHLFARTFYSIQKDIARLADILGHSSINTTRIYTMENGDEHRKGINRVCRYLGVSS